MADDRVTIRENASPDDLREAAGQAHRHAVDAEADAARWRRLAESLRARACSVRVPTEEQIRAVLEVVGHDPEIAEIDQFNDEAGLAWATARVHAHFEAQPLAVDYSENDE